MQNFPTTDPLSGAAGFFDTGPRKSSGHGTWTDDFKSVFKGAVESGQDDQSPRSAGAKQSSLDKNRNSRTGQSQFKDDDLSREDFAAVKKVLRDHGVSAGEIKELEKRFEKSGLTWKELLSALDFTRLSRTSTGLTNNEKSRLMGFFSMLGFNPLESGNLVHKLENGKFSQAWEQVSQRLDQASGERGFSISREHAQALFKVMGIGSDQQEKFNSFLGRHLGKSEMGNFLAMVRKEASGSTGSTLNELLTGPQGQKAALSGNLSSLLAEIARIASREEPAVDKGDKIKELSFIKAKKENAPKGIVSQGLDGNKEGSGRIRQDETMARFHDQSDNSRNHQGNSRDERSLFDRLNSHQTKGESSGQPQKNDDNWDKFLSRIRTSPDSTDLKSAVAGDFRARNSAESIRQNPHLQQREFVSRQILEQVQNGIFKRMDAGRTQISLQLDPPDLGRVGVLLQMKDKEVRAVIRPTSPEVAQIISDNLARLKASLEQQGLRVNKIEVQTQTQEGQTQTWQGQEEHNKARERMREAVRMARMRGLDREAGQDAPSEDGGIIISDDFLSGRGLDIFA
ncbi:flagellar hook-length control protein FliK [Desulfonatronovibrio hydrogenovorans]|uniref:flagellar hook-length control protein FliK n=1 Tax=Desulfonatronovibrio hydrogenovorans TaxID=53245 RepID=UPI00048B2DCA|nr:flagellar hook-length control protein FliK [Desulfonatronovibrio hydrogenovorans]